MVSGHAVVRLPVSTLIALAVMACVFQFLYATVMKQPQAIVAPTIKPIDFRPMLVDHRERPKSPIKEPPPRKHADPPPTPHGEVPSNLWDGPTVIPAAEIGPVPTTSQGRVSGVAQPLVRIEPEYPRRAQETGIEGWVQVQFTVNAAGAVTDVFVVDSDPKGVFDVAATKAVQRWKYAPKVDEGRPVEMRGMQVILRFDLQGDR